MKWKTLPIAPNYEISNIGLCRRKTPGQGTRSGALLKGLKIGPPPGYIRYQLRVSRKYITIAANRAVALAFIGPPPFPKAEAAHKDGNSSNNNLGNIKWCSRSENEIQKIYHGTSRAKLTPKQVKEIRQLKTKNIKQKDIAKIFNISQGRVSRIILRQQWKHI